MGQRSRKARRPPAERAAKREAMQRGYARSRERNDAIRASLEPLAPGERPRAVTTATVFALMIAIANLVAALLSDPDARQWKLVAVQCAVLVIAAIGMWRVKYWAVLGFQVLLGITILLAFLALLRASDIWAVLLVVAVIAVCGTQFWFLIRAMARIQMPDRAREAGAPKPH